LAFGTYFSAFRFLIFFICALAETNRAPFDLPECETELVGGYHTEYSSMKLGLFLFAEYINMFISSAVIATFILVDIISHLLMRLYAKLGLAEGSAMDFINWLRRFNRQKYLVSFVYSCGFVGHYHVSVMIN
jgi:hypothetical protein